MDPDPGHEHFLKITDFFKKRRIIKFYFLHNYFAFWEQNVFFQF